MLSKKSEIPFMWELLHCSFRSRYRTSFNSLDLELQIHLTLSRSNTEVSHYNKTNRDMLDYVASC